MLHAAFRCLALLCLAACVSISSGADWAFGIFVRDKAMLHGATHERTSVTGITVFAASFLNRTRTPRLAMLVDDGTAAALADYCSADGSKRCVLMSQNDVYAISDLPRGRRDGVPRYLHPSRTTLFIRRWWLYIGMMRLVERIDPQARASGMALVTDVRDVMWQGDVFAKLRATARAMRVRGWDGEGQEEGVLLPTASTSIPNTATSSLREEPLFFAVEPFNGTVKDERIFNVPCASQCFPPAVMDRFMHVPLSCAGTTGGSWSALERYARAMQSYTLFCGSLGPHLTFSGMDQPMHMMLLTEYILGRRPRTGAREGGGGSGSGSSDGGSAAGVAGGVDGQRRDYWPDGPVVPRNLSMAGVSSLDDRWDLRYGGGMLNPQVMQMYPLHPDRDGEPAYAQLRRVATQQFEADPEAGLGRVVPLPVYQRDGAICTLALVPWETFAPPRENGFTDITAAGRAGGPPCAVVHQYDRHARLVKLADVLYNGVDPSANYWDSTIGVTY